MDLLDRFLGHDAWTTRQFLQICSGLPAPLLDRDFDIGHRTLRKTFHHIIRNMEIWSALMSGDEATAGTDQSVEGMLDRLTTSAARLESVARRTAASNSWNEQWTDYLEKPPRKRSYGSSIVHVITHSMHHRAQIRYMLRQCGVQNLPEGDVFSWEDAQGN